ncbi:MAG: hypothetical protein SNI70_03750 [Rikenellaceae bacterium]
MWLFFGIIAIITAFCNWGCVVKGKNPELFRFISLSATALTVCGFNQQYMDWVVCEDWGALMDCVGVTKVLWLLVALSILINGGTLLIRGRKQ